MVSKRTSDDNGYRGRIAPTPSGHLHLGHARTFWIAQRRAKLARGSLVLRVEDLDANRCKPAYYDEMLEDLEWFGFLWQEGPDVGGAFGPYCQRDRSAYYLQAWRHLCETGAIYPSPHSRKDVMRSLSAPHEGDREIIFPTSLRPSQWRISKEPGEMNWRFQVQDGEKIRFVDLNYGQQCFIAGDDFGDFIVWRRDGFPSYELAVVVDDHAMKISEVVRGEDLLLNTAKQILLYRALGWEVPEFFHCELVRDKSGRRLAKRDGARSLRSLREKGVSAENILADWKMKGL